MVDNDEQTLIEMIVGLVNTHWANEYLLVDIQFWM